LKFVLEGFKSRYTALAVAGSKPKKGRQMKEGPKVFLAGAGIMAAIVCGGLAMSWEPAINDPAVAGGPRVQVEARQSFNDGASGIRSIFRISVPKEIANTKQDLKCLIIEEKAVAEHIVCPAVMQP
jgi:hypothetical protein